MSKEYIEREALIDIFNAKADMATGTPKECFFAAAKMVGLLPAADVVEVVRCKDCMYWEKGKDYEPYCNHFGSMMADTKEDDYCSYGVAKMDGKGEGE